MQISDMEATSRELLSQKAQNVADVEALEAGLAALKQSYDRAKQERARNREILESLRYQLEVGHLMKDHTMPTRHNLGHARSLVW